MRILVTGSSGLIGSAVVPFLTSQGHEVVRLVRPGKAAGEGVVVWDPEAGMVDTGALEKMDAVVHLAGENIASGRWTDGLKKRIRDSRVRGTQLLSESLAALAAPPRVMISASAVGYYGSRGEEVLTEQSLPGSGFLAEVAKEWEGATGPARRKGIRVVNLRNGMVLSSRGGALKAMLPAFKTGAGGKLGDGKQFISWISMDDLVRAIAHSIVTDSLSGPVNAVSPNPVRNAEWAEILGKVLGRPTLLTMPAPLVRLMFGEMADALLLASQRVEPMRLLASGFTFEFPDLESALRHVLEAR